MSSHIRTVAVEEHFRTPELEAVLEGPEKLFSATLGPRLAELGDERIADMDAAGVDVQVLSSAAPHLQWMAPEEAVDVAAKVNDGLARAVAQHPTRFAGLATVPTPDPAAAARELERSVRELGFVGAMIYGRTNDAFLDDQAYWPILEAAEALDVPIYIHPTYVSDAVMKAYYAGLPGHFSTMLSTGGMGWHYETAVHAMRMVLAGVFERFPNLQIILGHAGEGIPFFLGRTVRVMRRASPEMSAHLAHVWENNFYISTSGWFTDPPLQLLLGTNPVERLLFAVDYPYTDNPEPVEWARATPVLNDEQRRAFLHGNADRLFRLNRES